MRACVRVCACACVCVCVANVSLVLRGMVEFHTLISGAESKQGDYWSSSILHRPNRLRFCHSVMQPWGLHTGGRASGPTRDRERGGVVVERQETGRD